jgi:alpha-tubulin suppressor-like RCC1 family protein
MRAGLGLLALAPLLAALSSCLGPGDFHCDDHRQCGDGATCEVDGRCSVAAPECPSQRRYVRNAGKSSAACVPDSCDGDPLETVSAGGAHACALREGGGVQCWGRNDDGQLGDGTRTPRSRPTHVTGLDDARAVAAGQRHSCAVRQGGQVVCWGANDSGQLGNQMGKSAGASGSLVPVEVAGVEGAVSVAAGLDFSCAVLSDGGIRCWGSDSNGQLGDDGVSAATGQPSTVSALSGVRSVSAFWQHACAVRDSQTLWCWGANSQGQLGDGGTTDQHHPVRVPMLTLVTGVGTGAGHTCAITQASGLFCWGSNAAGQLGTTVAGPVTMAPPAPVVTDPIAVGVGLQHTCAIRTSGAVYCWGQNDRGQLGVGTMSPLSTPVQVLPIATGAAVTAGAMFSCARTSDGALFCWGDNHYGQLALGQGTVRAVPALVPGMGGAASIAATSIAAGAAHTCVTVDGPPSAGSAAGIPLCWGADQAGQLGDGTTKTDRARAERILAEIRADDIAAGGAHTCAIDQARALWCWGRGNSGQLGSASPVDKTPTQVAALGEVSAIAAGTAHSCAISSGRVRCFGANGSGQLGDGTTSDRSELPVAAPLGASSAPPARVAAGGAHTCALDASGRVWCWGNGEEGAIGNGGDTDQLAPVAVSVGTPPNTVGALAAGGGHTCAVTITGKLFCWGRGASGQLGNGTTGNALDPSFVSTLEGVVDVAAGEAHTCAIVGPEGSVWCWGANDAGQLGNGTTGPEPNPLPVQIPELGGVIALSAGAAHTCALGPGGVVACWGADTSGQLGDEVLLTVGTPRLARLPCH